jgi:hypothetical protein
LNSHLQGLHPELAAAVYHHPFFGTMIDHPLVKMTCLNVEFPEFFIRETGATNWAELANINLAQKQDDIRKALAEKQWDSYVFLHERAHRFDALAKIIDDSHAVLDDLWPVIACAWSDSENIRQFTYEWLELWRKPSRSKRMAMSRKDRDTWRSLPATLTIYRGVNCEDQFDAEEAMLNGLSWTLSRKKAVWFARRGARQPFVAKGTILKRHCFAYFSDRKEEEIVIDPDWTKFTLTKVRRVKK